MAELVIVASTNPVKIASAELGFRRMFPQREFVFEGLSAPSGVADQPRGRAETLHGAQNRAQAARQMRPEADFWVGIEGGVDEIDGWLEAFAWIVVLSATGSGRAQTGVFILPEEVARLVRGGMELGHADDAVFGRSNSKQQNGSIGLLTGDVLTRADFYEQAVTLALIPFKQTQLTWR